jgi:toxin-antitoxin system PIN domain toxin
MRTLLDVNVLIAAHDPDHVFFGTARHWMADNAQAGFASCPLTQNGCVRIMSQKSYANPFDMGTLMQVVGETCASSAFEFWAEDISLFDATRFDHNKIHGHRQLTDLYLLALAVKHHGRFLTFDREIPLNAVRGAKKEHLVVL